MYSVGGREDVLLAARRVVPEPTLPAPPSRPGPDVRVLALRPVPLPPLRRLPTRPSAARSQPPPAAPPVAPARPPRTHHPGREPPRSSPAARSGGDDGGAWRPRRARRPRATARVRVTVPTGPTLPGWLRARSRSEAAAVRARGDAEEAQEGAAHDLRAGIPALRGDHLDAVGRFLEAAPRAFHPRALDEAG